MKNTQTTISQSKLNEVLENMEIHTLTENNQSIFFQDTRIAHVSQLGKITLVNKNFTNSQSEQVQNAIAKNFYNQIQNGESLSDAAQEIPSRYGFMF